MKLNWGTKQKKIVTRNNFPDKTVARQDGRNADAATKKKKMPAIPNHPPMLQETGTGVACTTPRLVGNYGVVVPWLHQIGSSLQVLGNGRSGIVTKNLWSGQEVAVKKFILQEDDERSVYRVYKHECKVLLSLRSLWGTHVPKLLFRKPWTTSPMIGLQLGEQLADDMSHMGTRGPTESQRDHCKSCYSRLGSARYPRGRLRSFA
jgi:hypothetical protein